MIELDDATWLGGLCWELDYYKQALWPNSAAARLRAIANRVRHDGRIHEADGEQAALALELYADQIRATGTIAHVVETPDGSRVNVTTTNLLTIASVLLEASRHERRSRQRLIVDTRRSLK